MIERLTSFSLTTVQQILRWMACRPIVGHSCCMTIRNLPDNVHRALRVRAAMHGQSTEAEVRNILEKAVNPESHIKMGDALAELGRKIGLTNKDFENFNQVKDKTPAEPTRFE